MFGSTATVYHAIIVAATRNIVTVWLLTNLRRATAFAVHFLATVVASKFGAATSGAWRTMDDNQTAS